MARNPAALLQEYLQDNLVVHLSSLYGTTNKTWTSVDDRYTFGKFSSTQLDLNWVGTSLDLDGGDVGLYADTLTEDKVKTEMTIEVVMSDFTVSSKDTGIVFALNSGASLSSDIYNKCKGIRGTCPDGILSSYYFADQDRPSGLIQSYNGLKTIAITNGAALTGTRIAYYINGKLTPSILVSSYKTAASTPAKFGIAGTGTTVGSGWESGLKARIHAVRFYYDILTEEQADRNHELDMKLYS
ncbi:MAG: hypothetical protein ACI305_05895 [Lepagella sp.]